MAIQLTEEELKKRKRKLLGLPEEQEETPFGTFPKAKSPSLVTKPTDIRPPLMELPEEETPFGVFPRQPKTELPALEETPFGVFTPEGKKQLMPTEFHQMIKELYPEIPEGTQEKEIGILLQNQPDVFLKDLLKRGTQPTQEVLLRQLGATEEDLDQIFTPEIRRVNLQKSIEAVFPRFTTEEFASLVETDFESFIDVMRTGGRTKAKQDLLLAMGMGWEEVNEILNVQKIFASVDGIRKQLTVAGDNRAYDQNGVWVGTFDPMRKQFTKISLLEKAGRNFVAGFGDVAQSGASVGRWLGIDYINEGYQNIADRLLRGAPLPSQKEFEWADLLSPEFYATKTVRTIPFALSLLPLAVVGFTAGSAIGAATGLGYLGSLILGGLSSAALSRPLESAMEAGGAYDDAIARGLSEKEASEQAKKAFQMNMTLAGADAFEIAIALAPTPKWVPSALVKKGLVRTAQVGGKMIITGLSQGGGEVYQNMILRRARGEDWKLSPEDKEVFAIGMTLGVGMGLAGDVMSGVVDRAKTQMGSSMRKDFDSFVAKFKKEGSTQKEAEAQALERIAQTPEGESIIKKAIQTGKKIISEERGAIGKEGEISKAEQDKLEIMARDVGIAAGEQIKPPPLVPETFEKPVTSEVTGKPWFRGTVSTELGGDTFWSSSESVAGDYGTAKVGKQANVRQIQPQEMPKNTYVVKGSKQELADSLDIKLDPYTQGHEFDAEAKRILQAQGYDSIYYPEGTLGAEELHIFSVPVTPTATAVEPVPPPVTEREAAPSEKPSQAEVQQQEFVKEYAGSKGQEPPPPPPEAPAVTAEYPPDMPASQQVAKRISFDPDKVSLRERFLRGRNKAIAQWLDRLHPIEKFVSTAKKGGVKLSVQENPYIQARLLEGVVSKATVFLDYGTFGRKFWKMEKGKAVPDYKGESFNSIMEPVKEPERWRDFSTYLTSVHAQELSELGIETGIKPELASGAITELEAKHPDFPKLAQKIEKYQKDLLDYVEESGLISTDLRAKLDAKYYAYVPFYRVLDELQGKGFMGKKMADISSPVKRIKGSEREIVNPLESIVKNTYAMINAADRNQIGVMMARLSQQNPQLQEMFNPVKTPTAKVATVTAKELGIDITGLSEAEAEGVFNIFRPSFFTPDNVVTVMIDGKKQFFEVDPDLHKALVSMDTANMGLLWKILSAPAKLLRAGATLSPDFMMRNPARDAMTAMTYSNYGFIPGLDFMRGVASVVRKDKTYQLYKLSGAEHAMLVSLDRDYLSKSFKEIVDGKKFSDYVKHPLSFMQIVSELGEKATRLGEFKKGIESGAIPEAAGFSSREVTLDFAKAGTQARAVNQIIAFFNANIRGWDRMVMAFKDHPVRTSAKVFAGITLPSILLWAVNHDEDWWKEVPQWQKDLFWLFKIGDTIYRIPKPFELGIIFGSGPERMLDFLAEKDPKMITGWLESMTQAGLPGWLPSGVEPIIENITNHSFFRGTPIVPASLKDLPLELQYTEYTSELAKIMGKVLNQSPMKIDNLLYGWTAGLGRYATQGIDKLLEKTGITPPTIEPSPTLSDIPVARSFVVRNPIGGSSASVDTFYDELEKYTAEEKRLKLLIENNERADYEKEKAAHPELLFTYDDSTDTFYSASRRFLTRVSGEMSDIRKLQDKIYKDKEMTPEQKRQLIDGLDTIKTEMAKKALALLKNPSDETALLEMDVDEVEGKLGQIEEEASPISIEKSSFYGMDDLARELTKSEGDSPLKTLLEKNKSILNDIANLPDQPLYKIDRSIPQLGLTRRQNELLDQYDVAEDKKAFLAEHPELKENPKNDWLRDNPEANAILSLWGNAKLLTQQAYDIAIKLMDSNDIPNNALEEKTLPPKDLVKPFFELSDVVADWGTNSWEAQLVGAQNPKLFEWLGREPVDTPTKALELKVKHRGIYDQIDALSDKESPDYIADDKARAEAVKKLKTPEFINDSRRIQAYENDGEQFVEKWVERGKLQDEREGFNAEDKLWLVDNPDVHEWALTNKLLTDEGKDWNIPALRIDAQYRKEDEEYNALPTEGTARADYLTENEDYRKDRRRREAYQTKFPEPEVENYVSYYELPTKGFRQERFLTDNPEFAKVLHNIKGIDLPKPQDVPSERYDEIYEANQETFDKLWGLSDNKSDFYIEDTEQRELTRQAMRFNKNGKITPFGMAEIELEGHRKFVPENQILNYVGYYTIISEGKPKDWERRFKTDLYYEDDWFMIEHMDFYKEVYLKVLGNERKDFRKVPSREVFKKYITYQDTMEGTPRENYRFDNPDLDEWLVLKFGYTPISEKKRREGLTPSERAKENIYRQEQSWDEQLRRIEELLKGVR